MKMTTGNSSRRAAATELFRSSDHSSSLMLLLVIYFPAGKLFSPHTLCRAVERSLAEGAAGGAGSVLTGSSVNSDPPGAGATAWPVAGALSGNFPDASRQVRWRFGELDPRRPSALLP